MMLFPVLFIIIIYYQNFSKEIIWRLFFSLFHWFCSCKPTKLKLNTQLPSTWIWLTNFIWSILYMVCMCMCMCINVFSVHCTGYFILHIVDILLLRCEKYRKTKEMENTLATSKWNEMNLVSKALNLCPTTAGFGQKVNMVECPQLFSYH